MNRKPNYAFIDSQNLNLGVRSMGWVLDFKKFRIYLKNKYNIEKAFLFIGYVSENEKLYTKLKNYGYVLVFKKTQKFSKGTKIKGNVDSELVLHAVIEKENYSKAYIVSGDGDFYCLIEYLKNIGKLGSVLVPNRKYSNLLKDFFDEIVQIQELKILLEKKSG
jgi:uncharacterized LabA/DUF88 family protein